MKRILLLFVATSVFSCQPMLTVDDAGWDAGKDGFDAGADMQPDASLDGSDRDDHLADEADFPSDGDSATLEDGSDDGGLPSDPGPAKPCPPVKFTYSGQANTVLVSGTFNEWAASISEGAWELRDDDHNGVFELEKEIPSGRYFYKLIVDGNWILDPSNNIKQNDGCGNENSVLEIDCDVHLNVVEHQQNDTARTISAVVELTPAQAQLLPASVQATLDNQAVESSAISITGNRISTNLSGVSYGIHDLRLRAEASDGRQARPILLKFYLGQSSSWPSGVMYFAMLDRFANGNSANDAPLAGVDSRTNYQGGDFAGLRQKIEEGYFDQLGVTSMWITWPGDNFDGYIDSARPDEHRCGLSGNDQIRTQPVRYTAYHGYWPVKLFETEEHFGTWQELKALVDSAHAHGIRVLFDLVINHVHTDSELYRNHPKFFNFYGEGQNHICSKIGWDTDPERCWFTSFLGDLDYCNPQAVEYMVQLALDWIVESGADGFRLDAVKHVNKAFLRRLRERLKKEIELTGITFYLVGETFTGDAGLIASYLSEELIHGQFDFPVNLYVLQALAKDQIGLSQMNTQARIAKGVYHDAYPGEIMSNFVGNHDISRFSSLAAGDIVCGIWDEVSNQAQGWLFPPGQPSKPEAYNRLQLAFTYIMGVPGVPLIYYGDEFGMPGAGDPDNRRMMKFSNDLTQPEKDMLEFMKRLGLARASSPALQSGDWPPPLVAETDLLAWSRSTSTQTAVIVINRGSSPRTLQLSIGGPNVPDGTKFQQVLEATPSECTVSGGKLPVTIGALQAQIWLSK